MAHGIRLATGIWIAALGVHSALAGEPCYYTTTEIPGTQNAFPVAINNRGHVIGNFLRVRHGVVFSGRRRRACGCCRGRRGTRTSR